MLRGRTLLGLVTAVAAATNGLVPGYAFAGTASPETGAPVHTTGDVSGARSAEAVLSTSTAFRKFGSPASASRYTATRPNTVARASVTPSSVVGGKTIYATVSDITCSPDTGTGTFGNPYCEIEDAVKAASPGDTVKIVDDQGYGYDQSPITISTNGLTIDGAGNSFGALNDTAITVSGASGVTIKNLQITVNGGTPVALVGAMDFTLDHGSLEAGYGGSPVISVDGASQGVTVSHTYLDDEGFIPKDGGIVVASGARNVTLAADALAVTGIDATGVGGLDIVNNTIQRGCYSAVDVASSTNVAIENNLFEDANPTTDYMMGGFETRCVAQGYAWAPDVTVDASSSPSTTTDYNDFYIYGSDATEPYSWAGTAYATLSAFQTRVSQGAHDTLDSMEAAEANLPPNTFGAIDLMPQAGAIGNTGANPSAPGYVGTDFYAKSPLLSRGAVEYDPVDPRLSAAVSLGGASGHTAYFGFNYGGTAVPLATTIDWGDGTSASSTVQGGYGNVIPHLFTTYGTYTISTTAMDSAGSTVTASTTYAFEPNPVPNLTLSMSGQYTSALGISVTAATSASGLPYFLDATCTFSWGDGTSNSVDTNIGLSQNDTHEYTRPGTYTVTVTVTDGLGDTASNSAIAPTVGTDYVALGPQRILDTRKGIGAVAQALPGNSTLKLQVGGTNGIPVGVSAVALNLTATNEQSGGYITAYPDGDGRPNVSSVNFTVGDTVANYAIVSVASDGAIDLYNGSSGTVQLVADVSGYFVPQGANGYTGLAAPKRFLDTRTTIGGHDYPVTQGSPVNLAIAGVDGLPKGVRAVAANITVVSSIGAGYVTAWSSGVPEPGVSNINFSANQVIANAAVIPVGTNGGIEMAYSGAGSIRLVMDVYGYYTSSGASVYAPLEPQRIIDTRNGTGGYTGTLGNGTYLRVGLGIQNGQVAPSITGVVINATVTRTTGGGYLSVVPDGSIGPGSTPATSNLNFVSGATVPNLVFARPAANGYTDFIATTAGGIYLVADAYGLFMNQ